MMISSIKKFFKWLKEDSPFSPDYFSRKTAADYRYLKEAATLLDIPPEKVPFEIAEFLSKTILDGGINKKIAALELNRDEVSEYLTNFAKGVLASYQRLGKIIPPIELSNDNILNFSPESSLSSIGQINVGWSRIERALSQRSENVTDVHSPDINLNFSESAYLNGFEEGIHAQHYQMDPDIVFKTRKVDRSDRYDAEDFYLSDCAEVFAGLCIREELRKLHPENEAIIKSAYGTDLFVIQRWHKGMLLRVPDYLESKLEALETEINLAKERLDNIHPISPDSLATEIEDTPETSEWRDRVALREIMRELNDVFSIE